MTKKDYHIQNVKVKPVVPKFIMNIDWSELRNQKAELLEVIEFLERLRMTDKNTPTNIQIDALNGILALIDAVQDYAVDTAEIVKAVDVYDFELEEDRDADKPTVQEIIDFKKKWGQSHNEICANLGYSRKGSDDLLMVDYFWVEDEKQWYPENNSCYTEREQEIADYLRTK